MTRSLAVTAGSVALLPRPGAAAVLPRARPAAGRALRMPFTLGVASGEPHPDGVVLWTRLAPEPLEPDGRGGLGARDVDVGWQLAHDEAFRHVVRTGTVVARAASAHSVHVEVDGLAPGRDYHYRFRAGGHVSATGRTRTAPSPLSRTPVHFAVASCSNYEHGYFTAYRRLAESGPDLVLHLGDYLYEMAAGPDVVGGGTVRNHVGPRTTTLAAYRLRHAQYKTDPDLQAAHAAAPWAVTYDDHDVLDGWAADTAALRADRPHFRAIRAAALRAFHENLPLRASARPTGRHMQMYRRLPWGRIASFHVLDTRQYRDDQICGSGYAQDCAQRLDPARSMLGRQQEAWLARGLRGSGAVWDVVAQQVIFAANLNARAPRPGQSVAGWNMDAWDGYAAARGRLLDAVRAGDVRNLVVLSGDIHSAWAAEILPDFDRPGGAPVGVELVTSSISSGGDGEALTAWGSQALAMQPYLKFFDRRRGWIAVRAGADELRADFRVVPYVTRPGAPVGSAGRFTVESGRPRLQPF